MSQRPEHRPCADLPDFAETAFLHDDLPPGLTTADDVCLPASWVTSRWVDGRGMHAHAVARQACEPISTRRSPSAAVAAPVDEAPRPGWRAWLRAASRRRLPGALSSLLPLFICVSTAVALIAAVLPMVDKP